MNNKGSPKDASDVIMKIHGHFQTLENEVNFLWEDFKEKYFLLRSLRTAKQNAKNYST